MTGAPGSGSIRARLAERRLRDLACRARALGTGAGGEAPGGRPRLNLPDAALARIERAAERDPSGEVVIGRFDETGRLFGPYGDLPGLGFEPVTKERFVPRSRRAVDVVWAGDEVWVRKDFSGDRAAFLREWYCLAKLRSKVNVPVLYRVDETKLRLYKGLLEGRKVRDLMIDAGARLLDEDLAGEPELEGLDPMARAEVVCRHGRRFLAACLPPATLEEIARQLDAAHLEGITGFGFTPGNVIVDSRSRPWFFDFDGARIHHGTYGLPIALRRRRDRARFERHYGARPGPRPRV